MISDAPSTVTWLLELYETALTSSSTPAAKAYLQSLEAGADGLGMPSALAYSNLKPLMLSLVTLAALHRR